jgi:hypothetical protein
MDDTLPTDLDAVGESDSGHYDDMSWAYAEGYDKAIVGGGRYAQTIDD